MASSGIEMYCLQLVFRRHAHDRSVTFSDVSKAANVPETEVHTHMCIVFYTKAHAGKLILSCN